jgi:hypothetical protein
LFEIDAISDLALQVMQAILAKNDELKEIPEDESGPLALARALSDFFEIAAALESGAGSMEPDELDEFCGYGLELLDRQSFMVRRLGITDQRDRIARLFASMGVWIARRDATIDNLDGTADGFGLIVNGLSAPADLHAICSLLEEVTVAASKKLQVDEERGDSWRPWRVINMNAGLAATRSQDPALMERTFLRMGRRLPDDMPRFLAHSLRQALAQEAPEASTAVIRRFMQKWPEPAPH